MTANEIQERLEELRAGNEKLVNEMKKGDMNAAIAAATSAVVVSGFWLGEIALQLATLNDQIGKKSKRRKH